MARDIDRKLRLTAALLGAVTRKDLAAAFRRVNPATSFDVERAHNWIQGRARPRELRVYEDWAKLLDLGRPGDWIAECDVGAFVDAICARHDIARETLQRRGDGMNAAAARGREERHGSLAQALVGTYACYSHAWSPYFRDRLIRGALSITLAPGSQRLLGSYAEVLPTGRLQLEGAITMAKRAMHLDLHESQGDARFLFCLFPPTPPASVLGGLMCGGTILGPEPQPSVTRMVMIRLPAASARLHATDAYLPQAASLAEDLAEMGLEVASPVTTDRHLAEFLLGGSGGGRDQLPAAAYRALVDLFDREWLGRTASPTCAAPS